jgi:hypothetical protein
LLEEFVYCVAIGDVGSLLPVGLNEIQWLD